MERTTARKSTSIQALFDAKAASWPRKYGPGAPLQPRCERFLDRLVELCPAPVPVLDLGCGTGEVSRAMVRKGYKVTGCDISAAMIAVARASPVKSQMRWVQLEAGWSTLPFESGEFACVLAASVFEYLDDLESTIGEIARVLRLDGILLFSIPNPFSVIRRMEAGARLCLPLGFVSLTPRRLHRLHTYLSYLHLSGNRFNGAEWHALLQRSGLDPVEECGFSDPAWRRQANAPMLLLAGKKTTHLGNSG